MGSETVKIDGKPIVVTTLTPPLEIEVDPKQSAMDFMQLYNGGTWVRILDFTRVKVNFGDVVVGLQDDPAMREPGVNTFFVGTDELVKFAAEAAKQEAYGKLNTRIFTDVNEAISEARKIVK